MRAANLPSLRGKITNGLALRIATAKAISEAETYANRGSVLPASVAALQAFFDAGDAALTAIKAKPASIVITPGTITLSLAGTVTQQLVVTKTPLSGSTSNVAAASAGTFYVSSDPTKATVSVDGLVTAVAIGTTVITARNGNKSDTQLVTVTA